MSYALTRLTIPSILRNKAFILSFLILAYLAFDFWTTSRYPALDQKAMMAGSAGLEPLGFDTVLVVNQDDPAYIKVLKGTVNWGKTNQRGMTFGILFATALLTMLSLFKRKSFDGAFSNSALGVLIGTPLGVCVNCAAPIARGLHSAGMRLETTLAAMISSPTLNVIVLAMVFSLFPLYMAVMKVAATLVVLLLLIPLLSKYFFKAEVTATGYRAITSASATESRYMALDAPVPESADIETWPKATVWVAKASLRNFWFILKTTLPLMVLAGFLGSLAVNVIPIDELSNLFPTDSALMILVGLSVAALIGVFMPVPITFDVILVSVLMATGMPVMYGMVLLFVLGIYSVYSYMIIASAISRRVGVTLWIVIAGVGVVTGLMANEIEQRLTERQNQFLLENWSAMEDVIHHVPAQAGEPRPTSDLIDAIRKQTVLSERVAGIDSPAEITVSAAKLNSPVAIDGKQFTRISGLDMGIDQPYQFSILRWTQPFSEFGGIASGDVHNDGWADIVVSSQSGIYLYANIEGTYQQQEIEIPGLHEEFVANVALVDINNNGWLDLVYSTYRNGTWLVYNDNGEFLDANRVRLPNHEDAWLSAAIGFGDLNGNGRLDIVLGNWTLGSALSRPNLGRESSRNVILLNHENGFEKVELAGPDGETLSVLLSDWNNDGHLDLIVGNDFAVPDIFYLGDGTGSLRLVTVDDGIIPTSALLTMSLTTADINNDLIPEIYVGNVSGTDNSEMARIPDMCADLKDTPVHAECLIVRQNQALMNTSLTRSNPLMCARFTDADLAKQCIGMHLNLKSWWRSDPEACAMLKGKFPTLSTICEEYFRIEDQPPKGAWSNQIPQAARRANVLLVSDGSGAFSDRAMEFGLREAGWVWNAKFADLDNNEWQDIYIANGYFNDNSQPARESNKLFRNNQGKNFSDITAAAGMLMFAETAAYSYVDIDRDGDLDIVVREAAGPVWLYRNNTDSGRAIQFELDDSIGNRSGIGSKIIIHYAGRAQMRELQASGGFASFDAPKAHFGLGQESAVERVEVHWSTGERTDLSGTFSHGHRYIITRKSL